MRARLLRRAVGHKEVEFQGIRIVIEWPKGSTREGVGKDGKPWSRKMLCDYGEVEDTSAKGDGEGLDVYIGPDYEAPYAWVVEQLKDDGSFDENKVMLGFDSRDEAIAMYLKHYPAGWEDHVGDVTRLAVERLWVMVDAVQTVREQRMEELVDEHEQAEGKQARFLRLEDMRALGRKRIQSPDFQEVIHRVAPGKTWDELSDAEQRRVHIIEQNERLGIDDEL